MRILHKAGLDISLIQVILASITKASVRNALSGHPIGHRGPYGRALLVAIPAFLLASMAYGIARNHSVSALQASVQSATPSITPTPVSSVKELKPLPPDRSSQEARLINALRNPFAVTTAVSGTTQPLSVEENTSLSISKPNIRLTGIVRDRSSVMALVDNGSDSETLRVGDRLQLGTASQGGFKVRSISYEAESLTITNGPSTYTYQISQ